MSFETFSFFYYFVFLWGGSGMLFIAVVVIKEMLQLNRKAKQIEMEEETICQEEEVDLVTRV